MAIDRFHLKIRVFAFLAGAAAVGAEIGKTGTRVKSKCAVLCGRGRISWPLLVVPRRLLVDDCGGREEEDS